VYTNSRSTSFTICILHLGCVNLRVNYDHDWLCACMPKIDVLGRRSRRSSVAPWHTVQHCAQHCAPTWKLHHMSTLKIVACNTACNCCRSRIGSYLCDITCNTVCPHLQHCMQLRGNVAHNDASCVRAFIPSFVVVNLLLERNLC